MKINKNDKGFTLVELLLVMAIIGILAGLVFIMIGPSRKKARITAFKKTMSDITAAATNCVDNGGEIQNNAPGQPICDDGNGDDYGIGNIPTIKSCGGGGELSDGLTVSGETSDDFVITYTCPINDDVSCHARCDINGCQFDNDAPDSGEFNNDGCPKVK